ncbi:MAG TPA: glycosyltransferase family 4 protein [Candidatus Paceibacterota bacterium]|nr:glycosyltransferase family 4 protein [Candidatus Paceibacterota bacterium]
MRIAIVQPRTSYHIAGSEKVSLKHAEYLSRMGHVVDLYTSISARLNESFLFREFTEKALENVNILRFDISNSILGLYEQKPDIDHVRWTIESLAFDEKIHEALILNRPDIILSYYLPDCLFKPIGIPNVLYISGYSSEHIPLYRSFIRFCSATISISSVVSEKWSAYIKDIHLRYLLGTGVDYPLVIQNTIPPKAGCNLVFAGRLIERKGIITLIHAFKEILAEQDNVHLWILGDGELKQHIEQKIRDFGITEKVSVIGLVSNPYDYFSMADICVFPSHQGDGLMGTVLESMSAGKPVITTINNGNEDVIIHGENGILIKPADILDLKKAVLDLISDDEKRMKLGARAKEFIAKHVAWEKNAKKLSDILSEIRHEVLRS